MNKKINEAIEEIERMIDSYKTPKPIGPRDENFQLFAQFTERMITQGMEKALAVLKKKRGDKE